MGCARRALHCVASKSWGLLCESVENSSRTKPVTCLQVFTRGGKGGGCATSELAGVDQPAALTGTARDRTYANARPCVQPLLCSIKNFVCGVEHECGNGWDSVTRR